MVPARYPRLHVAAFFVAAIFVVTSVASGCKENSRVPAVETGAGQPASSAPSDDVPPTSAEAGKEYSYQDKVWESEDERELVDLLTRAYTAEKAYRKVRKDPARYLGVLQKAVRAKKGEVRVQAIIILGLLRDANNDASIRVIADALLFDSKPEVRAVAAKAFVALKRPEVVPELVRSLDGDSSESVRANSAWALGELGNPVAIPSLRKAAGDDDAFVRLRAVGALMDLRARMGIPELIERLTDSNAMVAERAHQALVKITGTDKGRDPGEWRKVYGRPVGENAADAGGPSGTAPGAAAEELPGAGK